MNELTPMRVLKVPVKIMFLPKEQKKFQNMLKNIYEVYQLMSFRCIMSLSYRVTFLCNVLLQIHYTSESPVRFLFYEKSCKVVLKEIANENCDDWTQKSSRKGWWWS